jgi:hypothetical protein
MKKFSFVVLVTILTSGIAAAQSKSGVCVWVDGEEPGSVMAEQPGGAVLSPTKAAVSRIQQMAVDGLRADSSNTVVNPCPQTGENIEIDVVVGRFRAGYVASVSVTIQGGKEGPLHVSSNVIAASTEKILASDVVLAYESVKFRVQLGLAGKSQPNR